MQKRLILNSVEMILANMSILKKIAFKMQIKSHLENKMKIC